MRINAIKNLLLISRQLCITCLLLGASGVVNAESFDTGVFEFQKKLADGGNAQAQFKVGNMYETGRGVSMDMTAATQWYEKAAANNYKPAKNRLVYLQVKKSGFKPEHKAWLNDVRADAGAGDGEAMMMLGEMNEQGIGMPKNLAQAQIEYKRASTKGIPGSEAAYYAVSDLLDRQKNLAKQEEEKRLAAEKTRKEEAEREAARRKAQQEQERQAQLKAETEQRKQEEERRRAEAQRRQLEEQKKAQAVTPKQPEPAPVAEKPAETFESDLCTGKAASFRTQCR